MAPTAALQRPGLRTPVLTVNRATSRGRQAAAGGRAGGADGAQAAALPRHPALRGPGAAGRADRAVSAQPVRLHRAARAGHLLARAADRPAVRRARSGRRAAARAARAHPCWLARSCRGRPAPPPLQHPLYTPSSFQYWFGIGYNPCSAPEKLPCSLAMPASVQCATHALAGATAQAVSVSPAVMRGSEAACNGNPALLLAHHARRAARARAQGVEPGALPPRDVCAGWAAGADGAGGRGVAQPAGAPRPGQRFREPRAA